MRTFLKTNILLLVFCFGTYGQSRFFWQNISNVDSLDIYSDSILSMPTSGSNRISKNIQVKALRQGDSLLYAAALRLEAKSRFLSGELNQAAALQSEALAVYQKSRDNEGLCGTLLSLALIDAQKGNLYQALNKLRNSENLSQEIENPYYRAVSKFHIGRIYFDQLEFAASRKQLLDAKAIVSASRLPKSLEVAINQQLALIDIEFGQFTRALDLLPRSNQSGLNPDFIYNLNLTWSKYWLAMQNPPKAEYFGVSALHWAKKKGCPMLVLEAQINLSEVYILKNNRYKSIENAIESARLQKSIPAATSLKLKALNQLYKAYLANSDTAKALSSILKFKAIDDSLKSFDLNTFALSTPISAKPKASNQPKADTAQAASLPPPPSQRVVIKGESREVIIGLLAISGLILLVGIIALSMLFKRKRELKLLRASNKNFTKREKEILDEKEELKEKNAELQKIDKNKNKVFSVLTHDIRQPVNQIKSVLELLQMEDLSKDDRIEIVQRLREAIDNSGNALENLLLWSKNQMTGIRTKIVDVHLLPQVWQIESQLKSNLESKNIKLDIDVPDFFKVRADMGQLDICLRNLLNNAIKFSNRGGVITIEAIEDDGDKIIRVIDNGVGMSIDQVDKLNNMTGDFSTLGTMNEKGTGLGVLITREFMVNQNGELDIKSRKGEGSVFSMIFPKAEAQTTSTRSERSTQRSGRV